MTEPVTVGIDIGTSSVKAVAADDNGQVVASARVPHAMRVPSPGRLEHDANDAWREGPRRAWPRSATSTSAASASRPWSRR